MVGFEPVGEGGEALYADGWVVVGDGRGCAGAFVVEILVNVVGVVVGRIDDAEHGGGVAGAVPGCKPGPRAGPGIAGDQDEIIRAGRANGGDGRIGGRDPLLGGQGVGLVHQVEDHMRIGFVVAGQARPEIGEGRVGNSAADQALR